jgi:hypothetical protein
MYAGHAFFSKEQARPTQAGDLLAWQWFTDFKRRARKPYTPRKDLQALIGGGVSHNAIHADENYLNGMVYDLRRTLEGKPRIGLPSRTSL